VVTVTVKYFASHSVRVILACRYTLGAMCAVQLYNAARADLPSLDDDISAGRFDGLLSWLKCKVHMAGSLHATADEVMAAATGKAIDPKEFMR
jgi:carboxypeptidase Taq